jgi:hypothetical protein
MNHKNAIILSDQSSSYSNDILLNFKFVGSMTEDKDNQSHQWKSSQLHPIGEIGKVGMSYQG